MSSQLNKKREGRHLFEEKLIKGTSIRIKFHQGAEFGLSPFSSSEILRIVFIHIFDNVFPNQNEIVKLFKCMTDISYF